jgi:hypothetical protein
MLIASLAGILTPSLRSLDGLVEKIAHSPNPGIGTP